MNATTRKAAIDNARALLDSLGENNWATVHVVSGDVEIFIATANGRENPMRAVQSPAAPAAPSDANVSTVTAPHVATVVTVVAQGVSIAQGAPLATIAVLGDEEVLTAPGAGRVSNVHVAAGMLVEYGTPLLDIAAS
jgi:biotin carboxyl carrier protein